jgi:hypothetical protein
VTPCSCGRIPTFRSCMLPPSSSRGLLGCNTVLSIVLYAHEAIRLQVEM